MSDSINVTPGEQALIDLAAHKDEALTAVLALRLGRIVALHQRLAERLCSRCDEPWPCETRLAAIGEENA